MIKFFRKIRQSLLAEGKFTQYLKYAVGEIVLVVIGILIALGLNDYYANVKAEERLTGLLKEVRAELAVNFNRATPLVDWYSKKDSLISMVMSDTLKKEVYSKDFEIRNVIGNYDTYEVKSSAFDRLMQNNSALPARYDSLVDQLKTIYARDWEIVKTYNELIRVVVEENTNRIKTTESWYSDWTYSIEISEEASEMMFTDPIYRNYVAEYWLIGVNNHCFLINELRTNAYLVYKGLSKELGLPDEITPQLMERFDIDGSVGEYFFENDTIKISEMEGMLQYQLNNNAEKFILPFSHSQFVLPQSNVFGRFIKNQDGKITGLNLRVADYSKTFEKPN